MRNRHDPGCDCAPCESHYQNWNRFLGVIFGGLFVFGLVAIFRAGLFAWLTNL